MEYLLILFLLFSTLCTVESSVVLITFTSSPNTPDIVEGDTAVYNCSSNHSSVTVTWFFNGTIPALSNELTSLGVTATGPGSPVSSLSVPGLVYHFNNTNVSCFASGPVAGIISPPPVILRVQGPPGAVVDISVNFSSCAYYISWTAPFTLSGFPILQYNINVTNGRTVIYKTNVTVTEWSYSPVEFGNYSISIAAVNSVGEGERSTINQKTDRYTITNITCADRYRDSINWIIVLHIEVSTVTDWLECIHVVTITCVDTAVSVNTSNITVTATGLVIATLNTSLLDDKYHTFTTDLSHNNGLQVNDNKPLQLSFFDVSNFSILSIESNTVTFMCDFLRGSQAIGCHISLNDRDSLLNETYSINITREIRTGSISVPAGNYSINVFDINENNLIPKSAAFTSTVVIATATSSTAQSTTVSTSSLQAPSPTASLLPTVNAGRSSSNTGAVIAGTTTGGSIAILIVSSVVIVAIIVIIKKSKDKKEANTELQLNSCVAYGQITLTGTVTPAAPQQQYENLERVNSCAVVIQKSPTVTIPVSQQYENVEIATAVSTTDTELQLNSCAAYGVVIQKH